MMHLGPDIPFVPAQALTQSGAKYNHWPAFAGMSG
jgi:hypothetical protein